MRMSIFGQGALTKEPERREGELYKIIRVHGKTFNIYYGYYDESDRENPNVYPMEMYPNFKESPIYTDDGIPFVTAMQPPCKYFRDEADEDNTCYQCAHYEKSEDLLGLCKCEARQKKR